MAKNSGPESRRPEVKFSFYYVLPGEPQQGSKHGLSLVLCKMIINSTPALYSGIKEAVSVDQQNQMNAIELHNKY